MQTEQATPETTSNRLHPKQGEVIDRSSTIRFTFDGVEYTAHPGDTVASALTAAGIKVLSRSFKYHRPRGLLCCAGHCPNCLVQIGDEPNVRACMRPVEAGMDVRAQNVWPSLNRDLLSLTQLGSRFMPVGFYYKTFIRPQRLWPLYEHTLRHAAGLGEVSPDTPPGKFDKQYLHTDVVVVGGGPAGISAALGAAEAGAEVLLFDENSALGGHLRFTVPLQSPSTTQASEDLPELLEAINQQPNITVLTDTSVLGWYQDNWLCAVRGRRLFKIRTKSVVVATGAYETPLIFDNNDLPGVMLGSAVQRLLHLFGILPGKQVVIVTANEDGWDLAADLQSLGVNVAAIVDERDHNACSSPYREGLANAGVPVFYRHTILEALGSNAVSGAKIARLNEQGDVSPATTQSLQCDLIVTSIGWTPATELAYMAGGKSEYDEDRGEMLPAFTPPGIYVAGRAAGIHAVDSQIDAAQQTGLNAAAFAGFGEYDDSTAQSSGVSEPRRTSDRVCIPGKKKRFVCYCEDVTDEDVETAIAEGYDSIELLKRYSTVSMGPCQGAMCSMNTIHLCARANGWTVQETGTTTARPPATPVTLGALAGQNMEPVQTTPIHQWHLDHRANMMVAGLWLRPNHYGDPAVRSDVCS